ncbi:hypothetical protein BCL93_11623 [Onishia taeanensis]|uniref:Uncharacterized protein n=1 Tax=Onishia taeanensis TaxID=284577 RepID=A0A328XE49_9GAMM|nr:hypothetical protein [Halomonas taeanensis]RAR57090.1 hypothetical protein BCL93_11623 [Halomonas taeanensis]
MSNNPLPATTSISEKKEGEYNQHLTNRNLIIPDHYHQISSIPLEDYIEKLKRTLCETYFHISQKPPSIGSSPSKKNEEELANVLFHQEYASAKRKILSGTPASDYQETLELDLCEKIDDKISMFFSTSFIWLVCSDLLAQEGLRDQSWAALVEFASLETRLEDACIAEEKRWEKLLQQEYGRLANQNLRHLKYRLIDLLYEDCPDNGWPSVKVAAYKLHEKVLQFHEQSDQRSVIKLNESDIQRMITNWMNKNKEVNDIFKKLKKL